MEPLLPALLDPPDRVALRFGPPGDAVELTYAELAGAAGALVPAIAGHTRVAVHANPRRSECVVAGQSGPMATAEVIASPDEALRCRERVVVRLWAADPAPLSLEAGIPSTVRREIHSR